MDKLNEKQKEAVNITEGPLLIFAGAGSGKTLVIIHRIARLLEKGVPPYKILAVTFTNKAAEEMQDRVKKLVGAKGMSVWLSTFHSLATKILRRDGKKDFTIYDEKDQKVVIKEALERLNIDRKKFPPAQLKSLISNAKNNLVDPESYTINASAAGDGARYKISRIYEMYQKILKSNGGYDFADLLVEVIRLLKDDPRILDKYRQKFKYIMVDEYQDTNYAQYTLIKLLSPPQNNICVVGDDDQSIYSFRGANIENILKFEKHFKNARVLKLEENYRSTQEILDVAHNVIKHNESRKNKKLWTQKEAGKSVRYREFFTAREESRGIVEQIRRLIREEGYSPSDFAIFYRVNAQSRTFEDALRSARLNYRIIGGVKFYERKEIKDILAYIKVLVNPADDVSMERIINTPRRGIGKVTLGRIKEAASGESKSIFDTVMDGSSKLSGKIEKKLKPLRNLFKKLKVSAREKHPHQLARDVIELSGYHKMLEEKSRKDIQARSRMENVEELVSAFAEDENKEKTLPEILNEISLVTNMDNWDYDREFITLMTVHLAKGLEFPVVFLTGMEEELFPHYDALEDPAQMEEERRLCYVGITRAEEQLYLTSASQRMLYGQTRWHIPSRFIEEGFEGKEMNGENEYVYD
ncbi:MAG: ATP-dependent helicase [Elusimicrobiota bacterium]